jgi:hypothetical protein
MADKAKDADPSLAAKAWSVVNIWGRLKQWNDEPRDSPGATKLQAVVLVVFLVAFMAWYANIYLTFKIGKRLKEAIDNADLMYDYQPVYDRDVVMKVANKATFGLKTYLLHVVILSAATFLAVLVSFIMWKLGLPNTTLLGNKSTFKLWMHTFTFFIFFTCLVAVIMFLMANRKVRYGMRKIKQVSDGITAHMTANVDFLNVLKELPMGKVKINPNVLNPSIYYVDNQGFAPGDEKKAAEHLFTTALYWWMMKNVPADSELRQRAMDLFDPKTVLMTAKDKFTGELTDHDVNFLKENLLCEDPVECQSVEAFADFYEKNKEAIMEHYNRMKEDMRNVTTASEDFEGSFNAGKQLYGAMTWLNGWIPALIIMFIGIAIIEAKSECPMWKAFGGTVIALGMLPIILRRYVF